MHAPIFFVLISANFAFVSSQTTDLNAANATAITEIGRHWANWIFIPLVFNAIFFSVWLAQARIFHPNSDLRRAYRWALMFGIVIAVFTILAVDLTSYFVAEEQKFGGVPISQTRQAKTNYVSQAPVYKRTNAFGLLGYHILMFVLIK